MTASNSPKILKGWNNLALIIITQEIQLQCWKIEHSAQKLSEVADFLKDQNLQGENQKLAEAYSPLAIQREFDSILSSAAAISKILFAYDYVKNDDLDKQLKNKRTQKDKEKIRTKITAKHRAETIRKILSIKKEHFPNLSNKKTRNNWEHFDENILDKLLMNPKDQISIEDFTSNPQCELKANRKYLRRFDIENFSIIVGDENEPFFIQVCWEEVKKLQQTINALKIEGEPPNIY